MRIHDGQTHEIRKNRERKAETSVTNMPKGNT
jgi:hypothetical protein